LNKIPFIFIVFERVRFERKIVGAVVSKLFWQRATFLVEMHNIAFPSEMWPDTSPVPKNFFCNVTLSKTIKM